MRAFLRRFLMHYGIYRRYPLGRFPALRNAWAPLSHRLLDRSKREPALQTAIVGWQKEALPHVPPDAPNTAYPRQAMIQSPSRRAGDQSDQKTLEAPCRAGRP
jgi:hypothetical protein